MLTQTVNALRLKINARLIPVPVKSWHWLMAVYESERWFLGVHLADKDVSAFINTLVASGIWVEILGVKHI